MGTLTSDSVKNVYQKLVWYDTSTKKLMYTDSSDVDAEVDDAKISGDLTVTGNDIAFGSGAKITDGNGSIIIQDIDGGVGFILAIDTQNADKDSSISFQENSTIKWNIGNDGDASDAFKMSTDSAGRLATDTKLTLDSSGNLTASNSIVVGNATLTTNELDVSSGDLTVDVAGDIELNTDGGQVHIKDGAASHFTFDCDNNRFRLFHDADSADFFNIVVAASGASIISTTDAGAAIGHLSLIPDGDLILDPASHIIQALDNTIGFTQTEPTFDATDTIVDFADTGNKQKVTLTDNCADIHFKFPAMSGNFICVLLQDGSGGRTISSWKTQDSAGNAGAGNSGLVLWAGGTAPSNTETANKADIASFYWDADNEIAYGTYTYKF